MMSELPKGWASTYIETLTVKPEQKEPSATEEFHYIDIGSIHREKKQIIEPQKTLGKSAPSRARQLIKAGDILVSMTRPNLNAVALVPEQYHNQIASTGFDVLRPVEIDPRWLYGIVRTSEFVSAMSDLVQGALYPAVRPRDIRGYEIPLAPLKEQKRIADKLDALLARVDACRERLDRIPLILKRFRQAVLAAATSGTLTEEWRKVPNGYDQWRRVTVGSLLTDIRYGTAKKCHYEPKVTPVIRIPNLISGRVTHDDLKYAEFDDAERQKLAVAINDILMIRSNGSVDLVGRTALVTKKEAGFLFAGYLIRLRANHKLVNPAYLALALSSRDTRNAIELEARSTSGVNNINTEEIRSLSIELPTIEEQHEIVRRVESLFSYADRLEVNYVAARAQVDNLTPSLLAKAFRGELVPQDPDDESASVLLERIGAIREAQIEPSAKTPKPRQPKPARAPKENAAMTKSRQDDDVKHQPYLANLLRKSGDPVHVERLFVLSELPVADFYKQLAWEVDNGHIVDQSSTLKVA
jgi:type I restriction enzyme S subunit